MDDLLDSWRIVTELEIRRRALGFKRPDLARQLESCYQEGAGLCPKTLWGYERRLHGAFELLAQIMARYFKVDSVARLGIGDTLEAAHWWTWMTRDERDRAVHRRRILEGLGAAALLLPVSDLVASAQAIHTKAGHRIGDGDVDGAQDTATALAVAYAANPDADTVRAARVHALTLLDLLVPHRATMTGTVRTRLQAVASDAASLVGYGDMNAGRYTLAKAWFAKALDLARAAGDRRLEALALASSAWALLLAPDADQAEVVEALGAAAEFHPMLPPVARAYVFGGLARERAVLGDDLGSGRFLELCRRACLLIPHDEPGWGHLSTHGELAGWETGPRPLYEGLRSLRLGHPTEALALFTGELATTVRPLRRTRLHGDAMQACVALGDAEQACVSALAALDEARGRELGRLAAGIRQTRATFPSQWQGQHWVRELDDRLALVS